MDVSHPRCAGLDVHKDTVVAAVRCVTAPTHQEVRRFATTTTGLFALGEWLAAHGCTHVAMEATGVYWKPVWHVLEASFTLVLAVAIPVCPSAGSSRLMMSSMRKPLGTVSSREVA